jgi:hypothetical protein
MYRLGRKTGWVSGIAWKVIGALNGMGIDTSSFRYV